MSFYLVLVNILFILFAPAIISIVALPKIFRYIKRGRGTFLNRFMIPSGEILPGGLWFQASSIGEVKIALPIARRLRGWGLPLYLFAVTPEGRRLAKSSGVFNGSFLAPFDIFFIVRKFLRRFAPSSVILIELQLWPNLIDQASRICRIVITNGRISDRSFPRYRMIRPLVKELFGLISVISSRTEKDRDRFVALGAAPEKVKLTGNIKYDILLADSAGFREKEEFGIPARVPVITAGSTHGGEEKMIINAVSRIMENRELLCVLAPRHIERAPEIEKLLKKNNLSYSLFSRTGGVKNSDKFLLIDKFGVLPQMYYISDICFVGGSLVPKGGQNFVEAVGLRRPVCVGPHNSNFHQEFDILKDMLFIVRDEESLFEVFSMLLEKPFKGKEKAEMAYGRLKSLTGALDRNIGIIEEVLKNCNFNVIR